MDNTIQYREKRHIKRLGRKPEALLEHDGRRLAGMIVAESCQHHEVVPAKASVYGVAVAHDAVVGAVARVSRIIAHGGQGATSRMFPQNVIVKAKAVAKFVFYNPVSGIGHFDPTEGVARRSRIDGCHGPGLNRLWANPNISPKRVIGDNEEGPASKPIPGADGRPYLQGRPDVDALSSYSFGVDNAMISSNISIQAQGKHCNRHNHPAPHSPTRIPDAVRKVKV